MRTGKLLINSQEYGRIGIADSFLLRLRGLLGHDFSSIDALLIRPCSEIHTMFMAYPIDALFINSHGEIVRIASNLRPFIPYIGARNAKSVIELPAGKAVEWELHPGETVSIE